MTRARRRFILVAVIVIIAAVWGLLRLISQPPATTARYLGVYEPGTPSSYRQVTQFAAATGKQPNLLLYYSRWGSGFPGRFAREALAHGAELIVQIDPTNISLNAIAAGRA